MAQGFFLITYPTKNSVGHMIFTSVLGILLALLMLFYPGGTMALMKAGFRIFQVILSVFIFYFVISQAFSLFKMGYIGRGAAYLLMGGIFSGLIWLLDVRLLYFVVAFFLLVMGISELVGAYMIPFGKFFLALLGLIDVAVGVLILRYPVFLAILIAWYILFWGVSRLAFALELRKGINPDVGNR